MLRRSTRTGAAARGSCGRRATPTCDLFLQAIRVDDIAIVGMNAELFFETGLEIRRARRFPIRSPSATRTARSGTCRAPRTTRRVAGTSTQPVAVPDLIFQVHPHPVALHPDPERRAVEASLSLLHRLSDGAIAPIPLDIA